MKNSRAVEIKVGRRSNDGSVTVSAHHPQIVQLSVSYKGERAASVVLTLKQVEELRQVLSEYAALMVPEVEKPQAWNHEERRTADSLS